jgi:hypothetical protein
MGGVFPSIGIPMGRNPFPFHDNQESGAFSYTTIPLGSNPFPYFLNPMYGGISMYVKAPYTSYQYPRQKTYNHYAPSGGYA